MTQVLPAVETQTRDLSRFARTNDPATYDPNRIGVLPADYYASQYHRPTMRPVAAKVLYVAGGAESDLPLPRLGITLPDRTVAFRPARAPVNYGIDGPFRPPFGEHGRHRRRLPDWTRFVAVAGALGALFVALAVAG